MSHACAWGYWTRLLVKFADLSVREHFRCFSRCLDVKVIGLRNFLAFT
jgi:hypothetical protein